MSGFLPGFALSLTLVPSAAQKKERKRRRKKTNNLIRLFDRWALHEIPALDGLLLKGAGCIYAASTTMLFGVSCYRDFPLSFGVLI